jgi:hypothetical protein
MGVETPVLDRDEGVRNVVGKLRDRHRLSVIAPRRAIGRPSAERRTMPGGAIGWSDFERGAVTASQRKSAPKRIARMMPGRRYQRRRRGGRGGGWSSGG